MKKMPCNNFDFETDVFLQVFKNIFYVLCDDISDLFWGRFEAAFFVVVVVRFVLLAIPSVFSLSV